MVKSKYIHNDEEDCDVGIYNVCEFYDDVSGGDLDKELVREARKIDMEFFHKMTVYEYRSVNECWKVIGKGPIGTRWVDTNKGDNDNPDVRSRLVAQEVNTCAGDDLYAATPPIEALKVLLRIAAERRFKKRNMTIIFADVRRAYFNAKATRDVYVKLPKEDPNSGDSNICGNLRLSMYGTRDAAQNWERECSNKLVEQGFTKGKTSPCDYYHSQRNIQVYVHGDNFVAVAHRAQNKWFRDQLTSAYKIKTKLMGDEANESQVRILNRIVSWSSNAIEYEADPRHAEIVMKLVNDNRVSRITGSKSGVNRDDSRELTSSECTKYRAATARCNFLAIGRPDIQFAAKEVSRFMSSPRECDWEDVYKIARYLKGTSRLKHRFAVSGATNRVDVYGDSDWAGDPITRKSTSGVVIYYSDNSVKTYSRNQKTLAMSSGEAELYAIVSGVSEGICVQSILADYGVDVDASVHVYTDSSAAIGIRKRYGNGRIRHWQTQFLWIQNSVADSRVVFHKVGGSVNPVDLMTKYQW